MTLYPPIKVGTADVYVSGTVICRPGQIVEITPLPAAAGAYRIQLSFAEDSSLPARVTVLNQPNNAVLVTVTNFGSGPTSTIAPVAVGNLDGVPLLLDVAGYTTGENETLVRAITFTVLQGRP